MKLKARPQISKDNGKQTLNRDVKLVCYSIDIFRNKTHVIYEK